MFPRQMFIEVLVWGILINLLFVVFIYVWYWIVWRFFFREWQIRISKFIEAATRYLNAIAAKNERGGAGGYTGPTNPNDPPAPSTEELRARAYASVAEIERRYGQKKP